MKIRNRSTSSEPRLRQPLATCPNCKGKSEKHGGCPVCENRGYLWRGPLFNLNGTPHFTVECPKCLGYGQETFEPGFEGHPCYFCSGKCYLTMPFFKAWHERAVPQPTYSVVLHQQYDGEKGYQVASKVIARGSYRKCKRAYRLHLRSDDAQWCDNIYVLFYGERRITELKEHDPFFNSIEVVTPTVEGGYDPFADE